MIDVYYMTKEKGECLGGVSLREYDEERGAYIWNTYRIYQATNEVLYFMRFDCEFYLTIGKTMKHEMGTIMAKKVNDEWININVRENKK